MTNSVDLKTCYVHFQFKWKKKIMLTCSVEWSCEHSFLRSRTFSDEILRGWTLVGSAHQITSVLWDVFHRSWWGQQTLSAEKGPALLPRLGEPHHLVCLRDALGLQPEQTSLHFVCPCHGTWISFPLPLSLLVCSGGLGSLTEAQVSFSIVSGAWRYTNNKPKRHEDFSR